MTTSYDIDTDIDYAREQHEALRQAIDDARNDVRHALRAFRIGNHESGLQDIRKALNVLDTVYHSEAFQSF